MGFALAYGVDGNALLVNPLASARLVWHSIFSLFPVGKLNMGELDGKW